MNDTVPPLKPKWGGDFLVDMPAIGRKSVQLGDYRFSFPSPESMRFVGKAASDLYGDKDGRIYLGRVHTIEDCVHLAENHYQRGMHNEESGLSNSEVEEWAKTLNVQLKLAEQWWKNLKPEIREGIRQARNNIITKQSNP